MKNYIIRPGTRGMFSVNTENVEDVDIIEPIRSHIDWVYAVPEDGVLNVANNKKAVKKGDVVIVFYKSPYSKNIAIVVNSDEWNENIVLENEYDAKETHKCENADSE